MWLLVGAATLGIFLATRDPLIAAALPYFFAAWPGVQTGIWLRLRDPVPARARTCFWFYLSAAAWQAVFAAFWMLAFLVFVVELLFNVPLNGDDVATSTTLAVALGGIFVASFFGIVGVLSAMMRGVQVCVLPNLYRRCRGDLRRIAQSMEVEHSTHTVAVVGLAVALPLVVLLIILPMWLLGMKYVELDIPEVLSVLIGISYTLVSIGGMILATAWCSDRVTAPTPADCWPESFEWLYDYARSLVEDDEEDEYLDVG